MYWNFSIFNQQSNYSENFNIISNSSNKNLIVKKDGRIGYASTIELWFEKFKGLFERFGAINRTKPDYVREYIIAFLKFGETNGWSTSEKTEQIRASLPLFQAAVTPASPPPVATLEKEEAPNSFILSTQKSNSLGCQTLITENMKERLTDLDQKTNTDPKLVISTDESIQKNEAAPRIKESDPETLPKQSSLMKGRVTRKAPPSRQNLCKLITGVATTLFLLFAGRSLANHYSHSTELAEAAKAQEMAELARAHKITDYTNQCNNYLDTIERANPLLASLPKEQFPGLDATEIANMDTESVAGWLTTQNRAELAEHIHQHRVHGKLLLHFASLHLDSLDLSKLDYAQLKTIAHLIPGAFYANLQLESLTDEQIQGLFPLYSIHDEMNRQLGCTYLQLTEKDIPANFWRQSLTPIEDKAEQEKQEVKRRFRLIGFKQLDQAIAAGKVLPALLFSDDYLDQLDLYPLTEPQLKSLQDGGRLNFKRKETFTQSLSKDRPMKGRHYRVIEGLNVLGE